MEHKHFISALNHPDIHLTTEFIKNKFYFATLRPGKNESRRFSDIHCFSTDQELIYDNFYSDFGPLNLGCLYKYCWKINHILNSPHYDRKQIIHYTSNDEQKRANAAFLVASYAILYLQISPKNAYRILIEGNNRQQFKNFQDASVGKSPYTIRLQDCLNALYTAAKFGFFNFEDFNLNEYTKYRQLRHGDFNWIIPEKFLAFIGPSTEPGTAYHPPEHYIEYFLKNRVKTVVRLNRESYDASTFTENGISHYDIFLPDGSVPSSRVLHKFLKVAENIDGPIAVHCKAGLGRTGSLIAAYLIKHYRMTAKEAIAWTRICRPGSVIGHQQSWLENIQNELWSCGEQYKLKNSRNSQRLLHHQRGIYSLTVNNTYDATSQQNNFPNVDTKCVNKTININGNCDHFKSSKSNSTGFVNILGNSNYFSFLNKSTVFYCHAISKADQLKAAKHHHSTSKNTHSTKRKQSVWKHSFEANTQTTKTISQGDFLNKTKIRRAC